MGIFPKEIIDPGAGCSHLPPLVCLTTAAHVTAVIFKKKLGEDWGQIKQLLQLPEAPAEVY